MSEVYLVELLSLGTGRGGSVTTFRYAALANTPEEAISAVEKLVAPGSKLRVLDERLSRQAAFALGLRQGVARPV